MAQRTAKKPTSGAKKKNTKRPNTKQKRNQEQQFISSYGVYSVAGILCAVFLAIFIYFNVDGGGIISGAIHNAMLGSFGVSAYLLPVAIGGVSVYFILNKSIKEFWVKLTQSLALLVSAGALVSIISGVEMHNAYTSGVSSDGGGVIGTAIASALISLIQTPATVLVLILLILLFVCMITRVNIYRYIGKGIMYAFNIIKDKVMDIADDLKVRMEENEQDWFDETPEKTKIIFKKPEEKELPEHKSRKRNEQQRETIQNDGIDEVFGIPNEIEDAQQQRIEEVKDEKLQKIKEPVKINTIPDNEAGVKVNIESQSDTEVQNEEMEEGEEDSDKPHTPKQKRVEEISEEERAEYCEELDNAISREIIEYVTPDIELLSEPKKASSDRRDELRRTAEKLITILADFGVKAKLLHVTQGPTVTRFEIQPDTGIKLSKIVGLADDMALNLAVQTVLVAPVPGKAAVGIEIPNAQVSTVSIREIIDSAEFKNAKSKLSVALGKDIGGNVIVGDIAKMPHVLIAGATGSGKSVCINTIVMSILYKAKPEDVKLIMVDPKVVELGVYNGIPHLLIPVVTDPKKAAGALNWAVSEMMRRYERFKDTGVRKIDTYNQLMEMEGGEKMPNLVIIIDELADLMMVAAKEVEDYICRLAQLARAAGIHLIIATQRPSVDVITGLIKANVPSRIAFSVSSQVDSRTILDRAGAEKLLGMGDMLYHPAGARNATRVQGAFVSDKEIENVLGFIKETTGDTHYSEDLAEQIERCASGENGVTPDVEEEGDPLLKEAISLAIELGKISTSMIQRRLGVGYARAGRIVDQMEARGIVSGANGSKPRDVLVSHADMTMAIGDDFGDEE